ncbi:hypothetical protein B0H13DRAFT_1906539 [Mycena leptocephala]|nr:hypothetical protein B0H13DRAFT_1906539 [Mycena leptocephala]
MQQLKHLSIRESGHVILKDRKQLLDLDNIFGVPIREKKLVSALKRACSSVPNAFRQDLRRRIRDSIDPATFIPLDKFTYSLASKYELGGVVRDLSDLFTIHAALLLSDGSSECRLS